MLIVSPTILNTVKGGGVTLARLFHGWPIERIAQVHADILPPDLSVCRTYYSVAGPLYRRARGNATRRLLYLAGWLTGTGEHGLFFARLSRRLRRWLEVVRPDVVVSQTGSPAFMKLTDRIVRATGARLVLHASDDWVRDWPATSLGRPLPVIGPLLARSVEHDWRRLVERADVRMAISIPMAESYERRYGGEWLVFANAIDLEAWPAVPTERSRDGGPFRIMYSGSVIATNQLEGLSDLVSAVSRIDPTSRGIEVVISTGDPVPADLHRPFVRIVPLAAQVDVPRHLASADALFLPSVFADPARRLYELSMPGKLAEYLASGRPVLAYAPAASALARSAARDGWAELVDRRAPPLLSSAIRRLVTEPARRATLVERARALARRDHDLAHVRAAFQASITAVR